MTTIKSSTTTTTAYSVEADTTGALVIQTGATPTTAVTIGSDQSVTFAGAVSLSGNQTTTGNLTVNGNTTLGDANTDTILMTGAPSIGGAGLGMGMGFRNRIINGAMVIDQRNAGASVTPSNSYTVDRWFALTSQASKLTVQQSTTVPSGFKNSAVITSSSAYSVVSGDFFTFSQRVEGLNLFDLGWGAVGALSVTLSFWVRSSLTGTFGGAARNGAANRSYPFTYTISLANTWEQKAVTIAGDTSGTWLTTNGIGIEIDFGLGVGSTLSGTAGAWAGANYASATGATSVVGTSGATFYVTGVQLEKGSTATSFDYRPYGTELALCQRYFTRIVGTASNPYIGNGIQVSTTQVSGTIPLPTTMRSTAAIITGGVSATDTTSYNQGVTLSSTESLNNGLSIFGTIGASGATNRAVLFVLNGASSAIGIATEL